MNSLRRIQKKYLLFILITAMLLIMGWLLSSSCAEYNQIILSQRKSQRGNTPYPETSLRCYVSKMILVIPNWSKIYPITIIIDGLEIADKPTLSNLDDDYDVRKNVKLYIDGKRIFIESVAEDSGGAILNYPNIASNYFLGARPLLLPGVHIARVEILTLNNKEIIYELEFTIK